MPCTYRIEPDKKLAFLETSQEVNIDDLCEKIEMMLNDPDWQEGTSIYNDYTNGDLSNMFNTEVKDLLVGLIPHKKTLAKSRIAVVAPNDMEYGTARMIQSIGTGIIRFAIFRDHEDAMAWLQILANTPTYVPRC